MQYGGVKVLCDTFNVKERFEVLDDNKEMFILVGGLMCVNAVVEMRAVNHCQRWMRYHTTKIPGCTYAIQCITCRDEGPSTFLNDEENEGER